MVRLSLQSFFAVLEGGKLLARLNKHQDNESSEVRSEICEISGRPNIPDLRSPQGTLMSLLPLALQSVFCQIPHTP